MSTSPSLEIVPAQQLAAAVATLYTSPVGTVTRIEKVTYANTDTVQHQVTLYLVPSGSAAGATNLLTNQQPIRALSPLNDVNAAGHYLNAGDSIEAFADAAAHVNIFVAGTQIT